MKDDLISSLKSEMKATDTRYIKARTQLLDVLSSNAQLLEYVQFIEEQLMHYKQKSMFHDKSNTLCGDSNNSRRTADTNTETTDTASDSKQNANRKASVSTITSIENFDHLVAQNNAQINSKIFHNLQMYQTMVNTLSTGPLTLSSFLASLCEILSFGAASVYLISHALEKITCVESTLPHLRKSYSSSLKHGLLSIAVKHKRRIIIADVQTTEFFKFDRKTDDRFYVDSSSSSSGEEDSTHTQTKTVCLEPLFNEDKQMIGILELIHSSPKTQDYQNNVFLNLMQFSRNMAANLLTCSVVQSEHNASKVQMKAFTELAKVMSSNVAKHSNIEDLVEKVRNTVYKSVKCDKVALFMVDEISQELWCSASDDIAGFRIPMNKGIVGFTVTNDAQLNIADAYQDDRFNPAVDKQTNYHTKTLLCVPIKYNNKVIGAMECINKLNDEVFTELDQTVLTRMAKQLAPLLHNKFMESALRIISNGLKDSSRDYLRQFMRTDEQNKEKGGHHNHVASSASSSRGLNTKMHLYANVGSDQKQRFEQLHSWDFDYFTLMQDNYQSAIPMLVYMFNDFGLCDKYKIEEQKLYSFFIACKQHYYDNPYHNFLHAFSVVHVCYLLMKQTSLGQHIGDLDVLTILIAALCHDLEHPGLTNAYQVNSGSDLAMRYNDKSVLENHHAHIGALLMRKPEMAILSGLSHDECSKVRKAMINIILHTDMSYHQDIVSRLHQYSLSHSDTSSLSSANSAADNADESLLCESIVHMGDLSNPLMKWEVSHKWGLRVIDEFVAQSNLEKEMNLKESMSFIQDTQPASIAKVQISFVDYVVKPLWKNAASIAPEIEQRLVVLDENRSRWTEYSKNAQNEDEKKM